MCKTKSIFNSNRKEYTCYGACTHISFSLEQRTKSTVQQETFEGENFHEFRDFVASTSKQSTKVFSMKIVFFTNSWKFPAIRYERPWPTGVKLQRIYSYQTNVSIPLLATSYHSPNHSISALYVSHSSQDKWQCTYNAHTSHFNIMHSFAMEFLGYDLTSDI